jgi:hypothetical protein
MKDGSYTIIQNSFQGVPEKGIVSLFLMPKTGD